VQLQVVKEFTCDDDSGTFVVKLQIQANFNTGSSRSGGWSLAERQLRVSARHRRWLDRAESAIGNINSYFGFLIG
jgi:hypothetical protein